MIALLALLEGLAVANPPPVELLPPSEIRLSGPTPSVEDVLRAFEHEPTVAEVQRWASRHAQVSPEQIRRWLRQSTRFAMLPRTSVEWRFTDGDDQRFVYVDVEGNPLLPGADHAAVIDQASRGRDATYRIRLDWDLGDLVMSTERIRVLGEVQDLVELRDQVLAEVTSVYFDRRRLQVERELRGPVEPSREVRDDLRLQELTARLDAATGGAFSAAIARAQR